jgi:hypothetical protein
VPDDAVVLHRADELITWYDRHATSARILYCTIKVAQIVLAAAVPVAAGLELPKLLTGSLGGSIVVLEGIQQLYRFHDNWVRYRWTNAGMQREKALWAARAGDYATADRPDALLALRIEDLTSREATQWVALQSRTGSQPPPDQDGPPAPDHGAPEDHAAEDNDAPQQDPAEGGPGTGQAQ